MGKQHDDRTTLGDRYRRKRARIERARPDIVHSPRVQEAIRRAAEEALARVESVSSDAGVEVGICSAKGFVSSSGESVLFEAARDQFFSMNPGGNYSTLALKSSRDDEAISSQALSSSVENRFRFDETIDPPWDFNVMQGLLATSSMHASAVETKSSDYAYSGWQLEVRREVSKLIEDGAISEDDVDEAREEAMNFLSTCADGNPIEDVCRDAAIEYEALGTCGIEAIRTRGGLLARLKSIPFRTMRFLHPECDAAKNGARLRQQRGDVKRYFRQFGDSVRYKNSFDPMTAPITSFPVGVEARRAAVQWQASQVNARTSEKAPFNIKSMATEVYVLPRRPFTMSDIYGTPAGVQALSAMLALRKIEEYNLQYFEAKGIPQYAIVIKGLKKQKPGAPQRVGNAGGEPREVDDVSRLTELITKFFTTHIKQSDRSVLVMRLFGEAEVEFKRLSAEQIDASFSQYEQRMKEDIRMSHRMPPASLGINEEKANIGSGRDTTQLRRYRDHIVVPGQRQFAAMVNTFLRAGLLIPYFSFKFNPIDIEEERDLRDFFLEMFKAGGMTVDEFRVIAPGEFKPLGESGGGNIRQFPPGASLVGATGDAAVDMLNRAVDKNEQLAKMIGAALRKAGYVAPDVNGKKKRRRLWPRAASMNGGHDDATE